MNALKILPLFMVLACGDKTEDSAVGLDEPAEEPAIEPGDEDTGEATDEVDLENGQSIHDNVCMGCHAGNSSMADNVPDLTDEEIKDVVENGKGGMPAQSVSGSDLTDLTAFLRQEYP